MSIRTVKGDRVKLLPTCPFHFRGKVPLPTDFTQVRSRSSVVVALASEANRLAFGAVGLLLAFG